MSDDQKTQLKNMERVRINQEVITENEKEHFLEEDYKTPEILKRQEKFEKAGMADEKKESLLDERFNNGGNIISQSVYNQQQEAQKKEIEEVLERDLGDIYVSLSPEKRKEFRIVGEQTAAAINDLFNKGKVKIKKIISLIIKWLSLIPGVNRFFLEQEAKIKADELIKLNNHRNNL